MWRCRDGCQTRVRKRGLIDGYQRIDQDPRSSNSTGVVVSERERDSSAIMVRLLILTLNVGIIVTITQDCTWVIWKENLEFSQKRKFIVPLMHEEDSRYVSYETKCTWKSKEIK